MVTGKTALAITASIRSSQALVLRKPSLLNPSILIATKIMKLSNLGLGLAVAASGLIAAAGSSEAFTLTGVDGSTITNIDTTKPYVFTFVSSQGSYQSNFVVGTSKITEKAPGWVIPQANDWQGTCVICSVVSTISGPFFLETVSPANVATVSSVTNAKFTGDANSFTISWDDPAAHVDFNDMVISARPVPVPAIVPGIALAGAFFGSKALKRNKKNAEGSVA